MTSKTKDFFETATPKQFEAVLNLYDQALRLKAENKSSKPDNIIKLDKWYQNDLPKKIKSRGKDAHLTHDEMVQTIKWKLARGKFRPNLVNLVMMNTPRVCIQETKKAFRKLYKDDLTGAVQALCNLKGVGPAMASAVLAAGAPHLAPFMADECLWAMPDVDSLDYTIKEYLSYVEHVNACVQRINENEQNCTPSWRNGQDDKSSDTCALSPSHKNHDMPLSPANLNIQRENGTSGNEAKIVDTSIDRSLQEEPYVNITPANGNSENGTIEVPPNLETSAAAVTSNNVEEDWVVVEKEDCPETQLTDDIPFASTKRFHPISGQGNDIIEASDDASPLQKKLRMDEPTCDQDTIDAIKKQQQEQMAETVTSPTKVDNGSSLVV